MTPPRGAYSDPGARTSRHRQTLVSEQVRYIFKRSAFHPQAACERMPQVVPVKIFQFRFHHRVVKPVTAVFERLAGLARFEHAPRSITRKSHLERRDSRLV